jgi:hypothetical protein
MKNKNIIKNIIQMIVLLLVISILSYALIMTSDLLAKVIVQYFLPL